MPTGCPNAPPPRWIDPQQQTHIHSRILNGETRNGNSPRADGDEHPLQHDGVQCT